MSADVDLTELAGLSLALRQAEALQGRRLKKGALPQYTAVDHE
jgi:hypothetical protein